MNHKTRLLDDLYIQELLSHIPQPPKQLHIRGSLPPPNQLLVTIVGSRKCSEYAKQVVDEICKSLKGQPISIISGLAQGVDALAHTSALKHNLHAIAVLGCGLSDKILKQHPNFRLAQNILESNGALISEYKDEQTSRPYMFPARNRIMAGLSSLVIIIEARQKSGTRITARLATDYNRDVLVVPNSIYSPYSKGSNELIKQGAYVYTEPKDLFELLKLNTDQFPNLFSFIPNQTEQHIISAIQSEHTLIEQIISYCSSHISVQEIIQVLLQLELTGIIKKIDGKYTVLL